MTVSLDDSNKYNLKSHHIFLFVLLASFYLSDQLYLLIIKIVPQIVLSISRYTKDYTLAVIMAILMMVFARLIQLFVPNFKLNSRPPAYVWIFSVLVLSHPFVILVVGLKFTVILSIVEIIKIGAIKIFIINSLVFLFASFSITQILLFDQKKHNEKFDKYLSVMHEDLMALLGLFVSVIYIFEDILEKNFEELDMTIPVKILIFILVAVITQPVFIAKKSNQE